jgi:putative addiction module component (TIGR02574 family)
MKKISLSDVLELDVPERIKLAQAIWDTIAEVPEAIPFTDSERREIDRRLDAYMKDPNAGSPWPEVRARLLRGK